MVMDLRLVRTVISLNWPGCVFKYKRGIKRNEKEVCMLNLHFFKRQLHVFVIIVVIEILASIMHGEKIDEADIMVQCFMLRKMTD